MEPTREIEPPIPGPSPRRDQRVSLLGVSWDQYVALSEARGDSAFPRMTYLDGELEIMSPADRHELDKTLIARLVEAYADEREIDLIGYGSTTYRRKKRKGGLEPDECYCVGAPRKVPDIAIEVAYSRGGIDKLEVYRRLEVAEVWFWEEGRFRLFQRVGEKYRAASRSKFLPDLDLTRLASIVEHTDEANQATAVREFRRSLRRP